MWDYDSSWNFQDLVCSWHSNSSRQNAVVCGQAAALYLSLVNSHTRGWHTSSCRNILTCCPIACTENSPIINALLLSVQSPVGSYCAFGKWFIWLVPSLSCALEGARIIWSTGVVLWEPFSFNTKASGVGHIILKWPTAVDTNLVNGGLAKRSDWVICDCSQPMNMYWPGQITDSSR